MKALRRWLWCSTVLVCYLVDGTCLAQAASAPQHKRFEQHLAAGMEHFKKNDFRKALKNFQQAYDIEPAGNLLYNIGRCHQLLGEWDAAIKSYESFVGTADTTPEGRKKALVRIEEVRQARQQPPKKPKVRKRGRALEWSLIGVGAAVAVVGGVFGGLALKSKGQFDDATQIEDLTKYRDDTKRNALIADIMLPVGLATAATGVILLLVLDDEVATKDRSHFRPTILPAITPKAVGICTRFDF